MAGLNGRHLLHEAMEMLKKEGFVVWGYWVKPETDEASVFTTHQMSDEAAVESATTVLESAYPEYFKLFANGDENGTAN